MKRSISTIRTASTRLSCLGWPDAAMMQATCMTRGDDVVDVSTTEQALILLDRSLTIVAFNRGAASMFNPSTPSSHAFSLPSLPGAFLNNIRNCKFRDLSSLRLFLHIGNTEYMCRAYPLEWLNGLTSQPIVAVYLTKVPALEDIVRDCARIYQLTNREEEVLHGMSLGLTSKTIAARMNISPNTVKVYLSQIMIKMRVSSSAGVVLTLFQSRGASLPVQSGS